MRGDDNSTTRVRTGGIQGSSPIDLIAIGFSRTEADSNQAEEMARKIWTRYSGIRGIREVSPVEIAEITGLDEFEILRVQSLMEIGRRASMVGKGEAVTIDSPQDAVHVIVRELGIYRSEKREHVFAILLDSKNQILRIETVHIGTLNASLVGPREIFRIAIREGASSLILAHNHPSGDPTPSVEDIDLTHRMVDVGRMLDIPVLDHVILGDPGYVSLHQRGVL